MTILTVGGGKLCWGLIDVTWWDTMLVPVLQNVTIRQQEAVVSWVPFS